MAQYLKIFPRVGAAMRRIETAYRTFGGKQYSISEPISITGHSVMTARVMKTSICNGDEAVTAALLHDFGHVGRCKPVDPKTGIDDRHQWAAVHMLRDMGFPPEVYMPIGFHVKAKQFLAAKDPKYLARLSEGSTLSLELQGGPLSEASCKAFQKNKWFDAAIMLRTADDHGKRSLTNIVDIMEFSNVLERVLLKQYSQHGWIPKNPFGCTLNVP